MARVPFAFCRAELDIKLDQGQLLDHFVVEVWGPGFGVG